MTGKIMQKMEKILIQTLITVFGAILGSFTTMLIHRLHFDEKGKTCCIAKD
jgi:hypothetical protein